MKLSSPLLLSNLRNAWWWCRSSYYYRQLTDSRSGIYCKSKRTGPVRSNIESKLQGYPPFSDITLYKSVPIPSWSIHHPSSWKVAWYLPAISARLCRAQIWGRHSTPGGRSCRRSGSRNFASAERCPAREPRPSSGWRTAECSHSRWSTLQHWTPRCLLLSCQWGSSSWKFPSSLGMACKYKSWTGVTTRILWSRKA